MNNIPDEDGQDFNPSLTVLKRIFLVLQEENSVTRTALSQKANLQYSRLAEHLKWLEANQLVRSIVEDGRVKITFTNAGREFAKIFARPAYR